MLKHYGPKNITREQVKGNYDKIVEDTFFINESHTFEQLQKEVEARDDLKRIDSRMVSLLMILGLEGLNLLSKFLRSSHDFPELSFEDEWEIYCKCDGFGKMTSEELKKINDGWDWSHVRDSSDEALAEAENLLIDKLVNIYNNYNRQE